MKRKDLIIPWEHAHQAICPYCGSGFSDPDDEFEGRPRFDAIWQCSCGGMCAVFAYRVNVFETKKIEGQGGPRKGQGDDQR
jgi:hypothetical protein